MIVLGLDPGVGSIGWAVIELDPQLNPMSILGLGSRIINIDKDERKHFLQGDGPTACQARTTARTMRKGNSRFKMRRATLLNQLRRLGMWADDANLISLPPLELWGLRARAAQPGQQLSLHELGRVLLHLNQKRGYRHAKNAGDSESRDTAYVEAINNRDAALRASGLTLGQHLYNKLAGSEQTTSKGRTVVNARLKEGDPFTDERNLLPRRAHIEEFDRIMDVQKEYYPEVLTPKNIQKLRDIIFMQRPLKSCKNLVSRCEFITNIDANHPDKKESNPKVAPRTSPLAELTRVWEAVNNIKLTNLRNPAPSAPIGPDAPRQLRLKAREYPISAEERKALVDFMMRNEKMRSGDVLVKLGLKKSDGFTPNIDSKRGLKGNYTLTALREALKPYPHHEHLLRFDLETEEVADKETGELRPVISAKFREEPLYRLWHVLYSISNKADLERTLKNTSEKKFRFGITEPELIDALYNIDFKTPGFSNRSAQCMRRLLPHLMNGLQYSDAAAAAGFNHSGSLTKEENENRPLKEKVEPYKTKELRQPTVEKILNHTAALVNDLKTRFGGFDEIRVELARELKKSMDERVKATAALASRENDNKKIAEILRNEYGVRPNSRRIQKYRMWEESGHKCVYCSQPVNVTDFLTGMDTDVEHIIPKSLLFDDSFANKACACAKCNADKGQTTALDFMTAKGEEELQKYLTRVEKMHTEGDPKYRISKTKYRRLLTPGTEIPTDFLERDLRQTQYISRKTMEMLRDICHNVYASSGTVTDFFRHAWGYDEILHNLNFSRFDEAGLTEEVEFERNGEKHTERRIIDWGKRRDHRHHAIDALTVALTRQGYVQRLNNLNKERTFMRGDIEHQGATFKEHHSLLSQWAKTRPHFSVSDVAKAVDGVAVSFKAGKNATSPGKKVDPNDETKGRARVPRGALHEAHIYAKLLATGEKRSLKYCLSNLPLVLNKQIRTRMEQALRENGGDVDATLRWFKENPLKKDAKGKVIDKFLCSTEKRPLKYCLSNIPLVIDKQMRARMEEALRANGGDVGATLRWFKKNPLKKDAEGNAIDRFACFEERMAMRYPISPMKYAQVDDIVDGAIRELVRARFDDCGQNEKDFAQNISKNPLRLNPSSAPIKTVRRYAPVSPESAIALRCQNGVPIGYANPGSNHHAAFYRRPDGTIEEIVCSFWAAVQRERLGIPAIVADPKAAWEQIENLTPSPLVEDVAASLPDFNWELLTTIQKNDMFVLGLSDDEISDALAGDKALLLKNLYRIENISEGDYAFRLHWDTDTTAIKKLNAAKTGIRIASMKSFTSWNARKTIVARDGSILKVEPAPFR